MNGRPPDRLAALLLAAAALTLPVPARSGDYHDGTWTSLDGFPGRSAFAMAYDAPRRRCVVYGGRSRTNAPLSDTWAFDPAQAMWTALDPLGSAPAPRYGCLSAMDSLRHRLVVFGGSDGVSVRSDVWTLTLGAAARWDSIPVAGGPSPRQLGAMVYDPVRDRVIVFGGSDALDVAQSDLWALQIGTTSSWTALAPTGVGPAGTYGHRGVYDPVRDRILYYVSGDTSQVFALDLGDPPAWHLLATAGTSPVPRLGLVADYDPTQDRLLLHGGIDGAGTYYDDTWALSLSGTPVWTYLTRIGLAGTGRAFAGGVYDPAGEQLVMIGGRYWNSIPPPTTPQAVYGLSVAPYSTWQVLLPGPAGHVARESAAAAYDVSRHELLMFGGATSATTDVDVLDLSGTPVWSHAAFATPPPSLSGASGVYDATRDRMLVFGGQNGVTYSDVVWVLDRGGIPAWSPLAASGGPPPARRDASLVLDEVNDRLIVYGGRDGSGSLADVWALSLGVSPAWTQLSASAPPGARYGHSAAVDAAGGRMLVFGGRASAVGSPLGDLWAMSLSGSPTWTTLAPSGTPPAARDLHTAVVDPSRHRMLVCGGESDGVPFSDQWSLALSGPLAWKALSPAGSTPIGRYAHAAVWAPDLDAMLIADGHSSGGTLNDAWSLDAYSVASVPDVRVSAAALAPPRPDPARESVTLAFTLARPGETRLEVFDLAGRRVRRLLGGTMAAGAHETGWDLRDETGRVVPAGVYLARLTAPGAGGVRRFVVLR